MQEISYKAAAFAAILFFGACVFTACSKDDDKEALGVDTTKRVDNYKEMENLVVSQPFSQLQGVSVGNAQDNDAKTGVTVFFFPKASMASAVVLGGGPASREVPLLDPQRNTQPLNALVFSGGDVQSDVNTIGVLASLVMEKAIADAILSSKITEEEYLANI